VGASERWAREVGARRGRGAAQRGGTAVLTAALTLPSNPGQPFAGDEKLGAIRRPAPGHLIDRSRRHPDPGERLPPALNPQPPRRTAGLWKNRSRQPTWARVVMDSGRVSIVWVVGSRRRLAPVSACGWDDSAGRAGVMGTWTGTSTRAIPAELAADDHDKSDPGESPRRPSPCSQHYMPISRTGWLPWPVPSGLSARWGSPLGVFGTARSRRRVSYRPIPRPEWLSGGPGAASCPGRNPGAAVRRCASLQIQSPHRLPAPGHP
jgi:hypothetical protein